MAFLDRFRRQPPVSLGLERTDGEAKDARLGAAYIELGAEGRGVRPSADPSRLIRDGLSRNVTVYSCIMLNGRSVAGVPWYLTRKPRTGVSGVRRRKMVSVQTAERAMPHSWMRKALQSAEVVDHGILNLLEKPNPNTSGFEFFEALMAHLLSTGNSYIDPMATRDGRVTQMWNVDPTTVKVKGGREGGFTISDGKGNEVSLGRDDLVHMRLFAPSGPYGLSPMAVASRQVDSDNEAMRWAYHLLANDCRPPGAFVTDQGLNDVQFERMKKQVREKYQGALNAGRPLVLDAGMKWISYVLTPAEVNWRDSRKDWARDICSVFNVPQELVGFGEATYANRKEAKKALYTENVLPSLDRIRTMLNDRVVQTWDEGLYLDYDTDQIEAMQEEQERLWSRADASRDLTLNERRALKGYPPVKGGDVILVSSIDVPLSALSGEGAPGDLEDEAIDGEVVDDEDVKRLALQRAIDRLRKTLIEGAGGA